MMNRVWRGIASILVSVLLITGFQIYGYAQQTSAEENRIELPIIMYHHILPKGNTLGNYCITPAQLREDFTYIQEHGYTPITSRELLNYLDFGQPLPEKPIMITFDDGFYSNYVYAYELLEEFNFKAIISLLGSQTDRYTEIDDRTVSYAYLDWNTALEMQESGRVEFANHTYNMHAQYPRKGCKILKGESLETYTTSLTNDIMALEDKMLENLGHRSTIFTYPFGAISDCCPAIIRDMGFRITLGCEEGMNYITQSPACLYGLKRYNRAYSYHTDSFFQSVSKGKKINK